MEKLNKSTFTIFALLVLTVLSANVYALSGSGTENDPYLIQSLSDFNDFIADAGYWNDYTRLGTDINLTGRTYTMAPISPDTSTSYGYQGNTFTGNFDGNGYKISNLTVNTTTGSDYLGLFGYLATGAEIKNLGIEDCNIAGDTGSARCGGLVGFNYHGTVNKCYATGTVTGDSYLGGLAGYSTSGDINNCYAEVSVTGDDDIGGLIGYSFSGDISYCYSTGAVSGNSDVGGFLGRDNNTVITACFWDVQTSGTFTSAGGTGKTTSEMQEESTYTNEGWDFVDETGNGTDDIWMIESGNIDYPRHWFGVLWGSGAEDYPWLIRSLTDFNNFVADPNFWDDYTRLDVDIDLTGITYTRAPISPSYTSSHFAGTKFAGNFNGNGYKISNLTIDTAGISVNYLGLFGHTDNDAVIKNLGIEYYNITGGATSGNIGGLVGKNYYGSISNCYASGSISTSGGDSVGGLVGRNYSGNINDCYSSGSIIGGGTSYYLGGLCGYNVSIANNTIANCYSSSSVGGSSQYLGGLCGYCSGYTITNCYSTGSVNGDDKVGGLVGYIRNETEINNCYATGSVVGNSDVGGLIGNDDASSGTNSVNDCFWDTETSGQATSDGGTGKTTAEMKTLSTFFNAGWNLIAVWDIADGQTYPFFRKYLSIDTNYDGKVDMMDFAAFADYWLEGTE